MTDPQANAGNKNAQQANNFQVHISEDNRAGKYANAVSVHVTRNEVVLDFGYMQPGKQQARIDVVSRVNLNHDVARSFMSLLQDAILDYQNKLKEFQAKQKEQQQNPPADPTA